MKVLKGLLTAAVAMVLTVCSDSPTEPADDPGPGEQPEPTPEATETSYCAQLGYPCTAEDVDPAAGARSQTLLDEVLDRVESGETNDQAAAWLAAQDGVVNLTADPSGIVFQVEGAQPTWLVTPPDDAPSAQTIDLPGAHVQNVVGHDTPRERDDRKKKAVVLGPFAFQLGGDEPGPAIQSTLQGHRDYAHGDGVDYRHNSSLPAMPAELSSTTGNVKVAAFQDWEGFDVIAVTTHGKEVDPDSWLCAEIISFNPFREVAGPTCIVGIFTGERVRDCEQAKLANYAGIPGIRCGRVQGVEGTFLLLDTDFFIFQYRYRGGVPRDGLDRAVVYMGGCHTFDNSNLADVLAGGRSEYFGWDDPAHRVDNYNVSTRLFELMIEDGLTTVEAYEKAREEVMPAPLPFVLGELQHRSNGDGLHIREITTLKNPLHPSVRSPSPVEPVPTALLDGMSMVDEEGDLRSGDILPFLGQPGDGENDVAFFYVDVDGVRSGRESEFDVTIEIDGEELGTWPLTGDDARRIDDYTVRLRVRQPLSFDVEDGSTIRLKASTRLPGEEDGKSVDDVSVILANPVLRVQSTIETSGGDFTSVSEVMGDVPLFFEPGAQPDDLEVGSSRGPLEYVRYDVTIPAPDGCTITTTTVDGEMWIAEGEVEFDDPEAGDFGVPDELRIFPAPEIEETITITCPTGSTSFDTIHWFAGFVSFHGGALGGPNELDESGSVFVISDWQAGDGEVYAKKTYNRTGQEDDVTFKEVTTLELRGPSYRSN